MGVAANGFQGEGVSHHSPERPSVEVERPEVSGTSVTSAQGMEGSFVVAALGKKKHNARRVRCFDDAAGVRIGKDDLEVTQRPRLGGMPPRYDGARLGAPA